MQIGIVGSGLMGGALGTAWARAGHSIVFSYSRDANKLKALAHQAGHGSRAGSPVDAAQMDAILIAVAWKQLADVLAQAGSLHGKIVLSCMLPMTDDDSQLALGLTTSGAEELAQRTSARVVGTFNTVWSNVIAQQPAYGGIMPSMFFVGDDEEAKRIAQKLIQDAGFQPVDAGALQNARLLEPFGLLMGRLGFTYDPLVAVRFLRA